jgi:hypothetical protein
MSNQHEGDALQNELLRCQEGTIPAFRIGRNWRIRRDKLLELEEIADSDHRGPDGKELQNPSPPEPEDRLVAPDHEQRAD